jgi:hypothetical protein
VRRLVNLAVQSAGQGSWRRQPGYGHRRGSDAGDGKMMFVDTTAQAMITTQRPSRLGHGSYVQDRRNVRGLTPEVTVTHVSASTAVPSDCESGSGGFTKTGRSGPLAERPFPSHASARSDSSHGS